MNRFLKTKEFKTSRMIKSLTMEVLATFCSSSRWIMITKPKVEQEQEVSQSLNLNKLTNLLKCKKLSDNLSCNTNSTNRNLSKKSISPSSCNSFTCRLASSSSRCRIRTPAKTRSSRF